MATSTTSSFSRNVLPVETFTASPGALEGTRQVVGPLTTTFSAPESCSSPLLFSFHSGDNYPSGYKWGFNCANQVDPACFPSNARQQQIFYPTLPVYTPAPVGCPYGWTSACGVSRLGATSALGDDHLTGWVKEGENLQVCCPNGWQCAWALGQNFPTPSGFFNGQLECETTYSQLASGLQGRTCGANNFSATSTVSFSGLSSYVGFGFAPAIALLTEALSTSSTSPEAQVTAPVAAVETGSTSPGENSGSKGLSTGAKAGIGAGVAGGVLVAVALLVIFLATRSRRKRRARQQSMSSVEFKAELEDKRVPQKHVVPVELETTSPVELDGSSNPVEIDPKRHLDEKPPLSALLEMD